MAKRTYNRRGRTTAKKPVTSDKRRAQRVKGAETSRATGSKDRMTRGRGVTRTASGAPRGAQGPRTAPQQGPSQRVSGLIGSRGAKPPAKRPTPPTPGRRLGSKLGTAAKVGTIVNPRSDIPAKAVAAASLLADLMQQRKQSSTKPTSSVGKYNTKDKDGTVRSRAKVGPKKVGPKKVGTVAESFDRAFATARKAGKKTFTYKGKKYTTKMKGE